jgi:WD40 repeat protein
MTVGAISPDGTMVAAGGPLDVPLRLWALPAGQIRGALDPSVNNGVSNVVFSPDGRYVAGGFGDGSIGLWETSTQRQSWRRKEHGYPVNETAFSPDGRWLVSASSDRTVKVWSVPGGEMRTTLRGHGAEVNAVAVSPDGRMAASGGSDGVLMLWDLGNGSSRVVSDPAVR